MSVHEPEMDLLSHFGQLDIQNKPKKHQFPLLKLPKIVLLDCIENLDVLEIILFSLLSKRAKTIANLIRWDPLDICFGTQNIPQIQLTSSINTCSQWGIQFIKEKESSDYPIRTSHRLFLKHDGNMIENSRQMTMHICEVFRSPILGIEIHGKSQIEWILKFQPKLRKVWTSNDAITSVETLNRILEILKETEYLDLGSIGTYEEFQITEPIPPRAISIENSHWVTLSSILNGTNSVVRLFDSKFTSKDINIILKEWQMGSKLRNLEYLLIHTITRLDADEVYKDLNLTVGDENDGRPMTVILFSLLSKRAKTIAKLNRWNSLTSIILCADSPPVIHLRCSMNPGSSWMIYFKKKKELPRYPYFEIGPKNNHCLYLKGNGNLIKDFKKMVEHIYEVFPSPIGCIQIAEKSLIDWIIKFQPTIQDIRIKKDVITSVEKLDCIFKNLKVTDYLQLESVAINKNFQYTEPIPFRCIEIKDSSWLTLPSILNGNNSIIRLYGSKWTSKDINTLLKEWQMGSKLQNLEFMEIDITKVVDAINFFDESIEDLNVTNGDDNDGRPTTVKIHHESIFTIPWVNRVRNLTRSDGMIGTLFARFEIYGNEQLMHIHIYFQVWKKQV
ncbi:hypothetical protein B9Z55_012277 [Caenorhabditis nigoni]|uniref:F-box domain-containing protein n=2 Tax=Caenorhabditis nigoni TaxID=1611254 RepID=A0A2G5TWZ5_9PELO|nr:hypothetical protein B9Z55_012277 [Caenorhabditis nigoni]